MKKNKIEIPSIDEQEHIRRFDHNNMVIPMEQSIENLGKLLYRIHEREDSLTMLEKQLNQLQERQSIGDSRLILLNEKSKFYHQVMQHLINWQLFNERAIPKLELLKKDPDNIALIERITLEYDAFALFFDLSDALKPLLTWNQMYNDDFENLKVVAFLPSFLIFHIRFESLYHFDGCIEDESIAIEDKVCKYSWYQAIKPFKSSILWNQCIHDAFSIILFDRR